EPDVYWRNARSSGVTAVARHVSSRRSPRRSVTSHAAARELLAQGSEGGVLVQRVCRQDDGGTRVAEDGEHRLEPPGRGGHIQRNSHEPRIDAAEECGDELDPRRIEEHDALAGGAERLQGGTDATRALIEHSIRPLCAYGLPVNKERECGPIRLGL